MRRKSKGLDYKEVEAVERVIKVREVKTRVGSYFRFLVQQVRKPDCQSYCLIYMKKGLIQSIERIFWSLIYTSGSKHEYTSAMLVLSTCLLFGCDEHPHRIISKQKINSIQIAMLIFLILWLVIYLYSLFSRQSWVTKNILFPEKHYLVTIASFLLCISCIWHFTQ